MKFKRFNISLRQQNDELTQKYEKERAKVFELNFELEHKKTANINKRTIDINKETIKRSKVALLF